ncbi:hypothetical protein AAVH_14829 [Aphelenchoides avenae]|nr:hypothetical protein AAVH_14829 [Aphelenchus avenae]
MKYVLIIALCSLASIVCYGSSDNAKKGSGCANGITHGTTFDDISQERTYLCVDGEKYVIGCVTSGTGRIALSGAARANGWLYRCQQETNGTATLTREKGTAPGSAVDGTLGASHCVQMEAKLTLTIVLEMAALVSTLAALVAAFVLPWYQRRRASRRSLPLDAERSASTARLVEDDALIRIEHA